MEPWDIVAVITLYQKHHYIELFVMKKNNGEFTITLLLYFGHVAPSECWFLCCQGQMQAADRLEKERGDAKNAVEEYVYDMRSKLCGPLEAFMRDDDRDSFSAQLTAAEDWLYDEGEDQLKQVYVDKLAELKVCTRE